VRGATALAAAFRRRRELEEVLGRNRRQNQLAVLRATDFLTGSAAPAFARIVGADRTVIDVSREPGEPHAHFEARAEKLAGAAGARRLVIGGIPSMVPDEIAPAASRGPVKGGLVALLDGCLHPDQIAALRLIRAHRFVVLRNGRRWGKTSLLESVIVDAILLGRDVGLFVPIYALGSPTVTNLATILQPVADIIQKSALPRKVGMTAGGSAEIWSLDNSRVGRSRRYDLVAIDEAAFAEADLNLIFDAAITPTLLDRKGSAIAASTPAGIDERQWFWRINNIDELGFARFHAPTRNNPHMPLDEIERLRVSHNPLVFAQEYEGEFVDLSGVSLFDINKMLVNDQPLDIPDLDEHFGDEHAARRPPLYDRVFMTVDCTMKGGPEGDASAFLIAAENVYFVGLPRGLIVLEWFTSEAGEGDIDQAFRFVVDRYIRYARRARNAARGIFIEDTGLGSHLIHRYGQLGAEAFSSGWTALGKNPRVMATLPFVNRGEVKLTRLAYTKHTVLKNTMANHFRTQLLNYRANDKKAKARADDLVDVFCMAVIVAWNLSEPA
jgi:hypothetical protein